MVTKKICILGGTGFVGHHLVNRLVKEGYQIRLLTRHRERHRELLVLPNVEILDADIFNIDVLTSQFKDCDTVINLVGILNSRSHQDHEFRKVHVELAHTIVQACRRTRTQRLLHMSALNADASQGSSYYLRTKGDAESFLVATKDLDITIFRPSVIFGRDDSFINRFASILKHVPLFLPLACPDTKMAPVHIGDVVSAFAHSLKDRHTIGQRYDLCGPKTYSLKQLVEYIAAITCQRKKVLGLNDTFSKMQALMLEFAPGKPFSMDNYRSLQTDSVCTGEFPAIFAIKPTPLEAVAPLILQDAHCVSRYPHFRSKARR
ncbi:MAG: complex I NDUFA9 subunit family protein [Gammaproteobacteria bacterium]|nr:complex I NDUFA9 subunit family protein [Gammaproteobacteria bacterium]